MKFVSLALFFTISISTVAQKEKATYNTKIDKAKKVEIKNGQIDIKHADSVFIQILISNNKDKVFLKAYNQYLDTAGVCITEMYFVNPEKKAYVVDMSLTFDKPIVSVDFEFPSGSFAGKHSTAEDANPFWFYGNMIAPNGFFLTVRSRTKIRVTIKGIDNIIK